MPRGRTRKDINRREPDAVKLAQLAEAALGALHAAGFQALKPHTFGRVRTGTLQIVTFQGSASDVYIWSNSQPLSVPELSLHAGWKQAAQRWPDAVGTLDCRDAAALPAASQALAVLCRDAVLPRMEQLSSPEALAQALDESITPYAALPKAFCHLQLGDTGEARRCLERFLQDPIERLVKRQVRPLLDRSDDGLLEAVATHTETNVRKHKLGRLLRARS